jgi:hypothetical protein
MTQLLQNLKILEMSGVDDPAHELPGWMVAKGAQPNPDALVREFKKLAAEIASADDLTDDEKVAAMRKALRLAPASVRAELEMEGLVRKWLVQRARENGHTIEDEDDPAPEPAERKPGGFTFFRKHSGASLLR